MDGIPVKISEKYKPPRKITLPASILNKFNAEIKFEKYDFEFERCVADQMAKLREQRRKSPEVKIEDKPANSKLEENMTNTNILTPIPMKPYVQSSVTSNQMIGGINISDFENDTSSPFDSVELKTINDMEELAHVLGGSQLSTSERWPTIENGCNTQSWAWGLNYPSQTHFPYYYAPTTNENDVVNKPVEKMDNETTLILQNLQKQIADRKAVMHQERIAMQVGRKAPSSSCLSIAAGGSSLERIVEKKKETLPNPISELPPHSANIARRFGEMGFPISRAARATKMFGPDEPKVIEFMLGVQSLEEAGYPSEQAERAYTHFKNSREDAVKFLNNLSQIMKLGLGFEEEEVMAALFEADNNTDKAVNSLMS